MKIGKRIRLTVVGLLAAASFLLSQASPAEAGSCVVTSAGWTHGEYLECPAGSAKGSAWVYISGPPGFEPGSKHLWVKYLTWGLPGLFGSTARGINANGGTISGCSVSDWINDGDGVVDYWGCNSAVRFRLTVAFP